jgi:two-component system chemotaxis sensor kinase CheA
MKEVDKLQKEFIAEAEEILDNLTSDLKALEESKGEPHPNLINKIFRGMHSLKGLAGMLKFSQISELSHSLENLLDKLRLGKVPCDKAFVDILYDGIGTLHQMISMVQTEGSDNFPIKELIEKIHKFSSQEKKAEGTSIFSSISLDEKTLKSLTEYEEHRLKENLISNKNLFSIEVSFPFDTFDVLLRKLDEKLSEGGEVISKLPSVSDKPDRISFKLLYGTKDDYETVISIVGEEGKVEDLRIKPQEKKEEEKATGFESMKSVSQSVRVDIAKLDSVMNIVGDLFLERGNLEHFLDKIREISIPRVLFQEIFKVERNFYRKINELQKGIIELRMVPIGQIYNKLTRAVRQLADDFKKEIELEFKGEDTELDKMMVEEITDPLIHIIRNAVDHGIEMPEQREKIGKPRKGKITIEAFQKGNSVAILVKDDGKGIDIDNLRKKGMQRGIISEDAPFDAILNLIFLPGFSTAEKVSQVSGRGVGLDVVKQNITNLNGTIFVTTKKNEGTTFEINLPITLAIIQALIVAYGDYQFAIPLTSVSEAFRTKESEIQTIEGREVFYLRDFTLPIVRLSDIFNISDSNHKNEWIYVVVNKVGERGFGIVVDKLLKQQEIIIKSVGQRLKNIKGIAGAAELKAGEMVLVLDLPSIMDMALMKLASGKGGVKVVS